MTNSQVVKILVGYGVYSDMAHEIIADLGDALVLEPEIAEISAHVVRVVNEDSVM
jgi:hypothetical protein